MYKYLSLTTAFVLCTPALNDLPGESESQSFVKDLMAPTVFAVLGLGLSLCEQKMKGAIKITSYSTIAGNILKYDFVVILLPIFVFYQLFHFQLKKT